MITTFTLDNGLTVIHEYMPSFRSVSVGVWVRVGAILETDANNGCSHFMEHMSFKDTHTRTARELAEAMDMIGGQMNAGTGKMTTSYYAKVIDEDLPLALDLISDMLLHPALKEEDIEKEKGVVLEEIAMVDDQMDDIVFDVLSASLYGAEGAGRKVLGEEENIRSLTRSDLAAFREATYGPRNALISVAGGVEAEKVLALIEKYFSEWTGAPRAEYPLQTLKMLPGRAFEKKSEQTHLALGFEGLPLGSEKRFAASVMNNILGNSASSRLFQRIREDLGLAYSVYSGSTAFPGCGDFTVYAAANPRNIPRVYEEIHRAIKALHRDGFTDTEFTYAKAQLKSGTILGMESSASRMNANGSRMALLGRIEDSDSIIRKMDAVTRDDVMERVDALARSRETLALAGEKAEDLLKSLNNYSA